MVTVVIGFAVVGGCWFVFAFSKTLRSIQTLKKKSPENVYL